VLRHAQKYCSTGVHPSSSNAFLSRLDERLRKLLYEVQLCTELCETNEATDVDEFAVLERGLRGVAIGMRMLLDEDFELSETYEEFDEVDIEAEEKARAELLEYMPLVLVRFLSSQARMPKKRLTKDCFCLSFMWAKSGSQLGRRSYGMVLIVAAGV
jgi:hypothetical protein